MNSCFINGRLTKEPETFSPDGSDFSCLKFSIANDDESKKQSDGSYKNIASFFDCEYWTKKPKFWLEKLEKGIPVVIEGRLKQQTWQKDGQTRSKVVIIVERFPLILEHQKKESAPVQDEPENASAPWEDDGPF
jgi:single-strand DNA-binding protein